VAHSGRPPALSRACWPPPVTRTALSSAPRPQTDRRCHSRPSRWAAQRRPSSRPRCTAVTRVCACGHPLIGPLLRPLRDIWRRGPETAVPHFPGSPADASNGSADPAAAPWPRPAATRRPHIHCFAPPRWVAARYRLRGRHVCSSLPPRWRRIGSHRVGAMGVRLPAVSVGRPPPDVQGCLPELLAPPSPRGSVRRQPSFRPPRPSLFRPVSFDRHPDLATSPTCSPIPVGTTPNGGRRSPIGYPPRRWSQFSLVCRPRRASATSSCRRRCWSRPSPWPSWSSGGRSCAPPSPGLRRCWRRGSASTILASQR